jgi:hypothetical protein
MAGPDCKNIQLASSVRVLNRPPPESWNRSRSDTSCPPTDSMRDRLRYKRSRGAWRYQIKAVPRIQNRRANPHPNGMRTDSRSIPGAMPTSPCDLTRNNFHAFGRVLANIRQRRKHCYSASCIFTQYPRLVNSLGEWVFSSGARAPRRRATRWRVATSSISFRLHVAANPRRGRSFPKHSA